MRTCPACGVAVVPGYVRCPKCQAPLPAEARRVGTVTPGGTAVVARGFPLVPVLLGGGVALALILVFALRGGNDAADRTPATAAPGTDEPATAPAAPPATPAAPADPGARPTGNQIDPYAVGRDLERVLDRQRMWSTVETAGDTIDVRSAACRDPNMEPIIDAARAALRNAGLTRLRCLEQSGAVVFERDL